MFQKLLFIYLVFIILTAICYYIKPIPDNILTTVQKGGGSINPNCTANFDNFCLTRKPRGYHGSMCNWWRDFRDTRLDIRPQGDPSLGDPIFNGINNNRKFKIVEETNSSFPSQIDGLPIDTTDPFKKQSQKKPNNETFSNLDDEIPWNRRGVDNPEINIKALTLTSKTNKQRDTDKPEFNVSVKKTNKATFPSINRPEFLSYDPEYYLDSSKFCQQFPKHRLCPNHWLY